jgi:hypothetical protein
MAASPQQPHRTDSRIMINRINNAICFLVAAAAFAMIGLDAGNHTSATHSGTQQVVEVRK